MPRYTEQEDSNEAMDLFSGIVFDKIASRHIGVEETGRLFRSTGHLSEADFETLEAYTSLDEKLMLMTDPNNHWDSVQESLMLRKKPKRERILKS